MHLYVECPLLVVYVGVAKGCGGAHYLFILPPPPPRYGATSPRPAYFNPCGRMKYVHHNFPSYMFLICFMC